MRPVLQAISWIALAGVVVPSLFFFNGTIELPVVKTSLWISTILWFVVTPMWMGREEAGAT